MQKVACYVRVSTDEQAINGDSLQMQEEELRRYANDRDMIIHDIYIDDGYTATNLKRPALIRLLDDIKAGYINKVLFTKLDRWSRGVRNYYKINEVLEEHKCDWQTIFEDYDTSTASGRLHINIMLSVAENESSVTSERIKAVFKNKFERGEVCSGKIPRGYKVVDKKLVIDETTAPMIQDIYNHYLATSSLNQTVVYVSNTYGHIHQLTLKRILTNPLYKGEHISGIKDYCEAIIEEEQWNNVQRLLEINVKAWGNKYGVDIEYLFTGLLRCVKCGYRMTGNKSMRESKRKGKHIYKVYRCQNNFKEHKCENNYNIPEHILEKHLLDHVMHELGNHVLHYKAKKDNKVPRNTETQKSKIRKKMAKLKDLYLDEIIEKETYRKDYEELKKQLHELDQVESDVKDLRPLEEFLNVDLLSIYETLTESERRRLWRSVIEFIEIGRDEENNRVIKLHFL